MKFSSNPFSVLFGIVMIGIGIASFFGIRLFVTDQYMQYGAFAIAAVLILVVITGKVKEGVGWVFLALWLIMVGLMGMFRLNFTYDTMILSGLSVFAGIFLILGM